MFTDIEGSTQLLERLREGYAVVLEQQRDLLRAAFARHHGYEVDTQGDSFFVAFAAPIEAITCAVQIQRDVAAHEWPNGVALRIRIGLHTGQPVLAATGYVGVDVHRGARIGAAAHGGQILVSDATRQQLDAVVSEMEFVELGVHRFKGLAEPTAVFGILAPGLEADFPPISALAAEDEDPTPGDAPYMGLLRFEQDDSELFFGREELVAQIAGAVRSEPFTAVVGASGSGKSSLVRAGVMPALEDGASDFERVVVMTPTDDPARSLAAALGQGTTAALADLAANGRSLLVVDQLEELFTLCTDDSARTSFVEELIDAAGPELHVLVTLRADFYAEVAQFPALREAVAEHQFYIGPMEPSDLRRAIEEPARRGGWAIAPGLVDLLLRDIGREPGALPLLSHALLETWHRRRGSRMTLKGYFESGEVSGAIARTADRLYAELSATDQPFVRHILLRLTELGEGAQDTRRRAALDELVPAGGAAQSTSDVLGRLIDARLVTVDEGAAEVAHEALIREWPLLREWLHDDREGLRVQRQVTEAAAEWHALAREPSLLFRGARLATAREWNAAHMRSLTDRETEFLVASIDAQESDQREREDQQRRELEAAQRAAEAERLRAEEQSAAARRLRRRAYILVGAVILAAGLGVAAVVFANQANEQSAQADRQRTIAEQRQVEAEEQRNEAVSRQLAAQANANVDQLDLSLLLSLEARRHAQTAEARQSLLTGLLADPHLLSLLQVDGSSRLLHLADSEVLAWSLNGSLATLRMDGESVIRLESDRMLAPGVEGAFNRDGSLLAIVDEAGEASIWDLAGWEPMHELNECNGGPFGPEVAWSPVGDVVGFGCARAGAVLLVDAGRGDWQLLVSDEAQDPSKRVALTGFGFSPDGRQITIATVEDVSTSPEERIATARSAVWDIPEAAVAAALPAREGVSGFPVFSPDGRWLAAPYLAEEDGERSAVVDLWDATSHVLVGSISVGVVPAETFEFQPPQLRFSPDSRYVGVAHSSGSAVWEVATQTTTAPLDGCGGAMSDPLFSHDGGWFALKCGATSPGEDDRIALLNLSETEPFEPRVVFISGKQRGAFDFGFSPDDILITSASPKVGSDRSTIAMWGLEPSNRLGTVSVVLPPDATSGQLSGSGRTLATRAGDGTVVIWDVATGEPLAEHLCEAVTPDELGLQEAWPDPSGSYVACGVRFFVGSVTILDAVSGRPIVTLAPANDAVVTTLDFSNDGSLIAVSYEDPAGGPALVTVWDVRHGNAVATLQRTGDQDPAASLAFNALRFSPDGRYLAGALNETIVVWSTATWDEVATLSAAPVGDLAFSPDGSLLATGGQDGTASLWDVATWRLSGSPLTAHDAPIDFIRFSPTGLLVSHDFNDQIYLWDTNLRQAAGPLTGIFPLGFSSDGRSLVGRATRSTSEVVSVSLDEDEWVTIACRVANRDLTDEEWTRHLPGEDYRSTCPD